MRDFSINSQMNVGHRNNPAIENGQIDKEIPDRNGLASIILLVTFVAISVLALSVSEIFRSIHR